MEFGFWLRFLSIRTIREGEIIKKLGRKEGIDLDRKLLMFILSWVLRNEELIMWRVRGKSILEKGVVGGSFWE